MLRFRQYTKKDKTSCLEIFDSNSDRYFGESERDDFAGFLDDPNCTYFVYFYDDELVACGGYYVSSLRTGVLCWGMVSRTHHRKGFGFEMTQQRIQEIKKSEVDKIKMDTSPWSLGFYEKFGFKVIKTIKNGYKEGLDRLDLELICKSSNK